MTHGLGLKHCCRAACFVAATLALATDPVSAHPHVWVNARAEILFGPDGKVTAIRHSWTFDEAYTAYVTQGLDKNNDGKLSSDELQGLADENTGSLSEFDYFTFVKAGGKKQAFDPPREPRMVMEKNQVTLTYLLPLKAPVSASGVFAIEITDPSFFVYFALADGTPIILKDAPQGCATNVERAKTLDTATQQMLSDEGLFQTPAGANIGLQYANRAIVACP